MKSDSGVCVCGFLFYPLGINNDSSVSSSKVRVKIYLADMFRVCVVDMCLFFKNFFFWIFLVFFLFWFGFLFFIYFWVLKLVLPSWEPLLG